MAVLPILVLTQTYPSETRKYEQTYVHTRLLQYKASGLEPVVLSFSAHQPYVYEGIQVHSALSFEAQYPQQDIGLLISHAPNLRNHVRWLLAQQSRIQRYVFFIHGHEVLIKSRYYPKPYGFQTPKTPFKQWGHWAYDHFKLHVLRRFLKSLGTKMHVVFVSRWMKEEGLKNLKMELPEDQYSIIYNAAHPMFIDSSYQAPQVGPKRLITVRPLDGPKYAVDLVCALAHKHPEYQFDVFGKGHYFEHHPPPTNLTHHARFLTHQELVQTLNQYHAALMPTRLDAQGVMMCEMATFGIPLITSDLPICKEVLSPFEAVFYFNNTTLAPPLDQAFDYFQTLTSSPEKTPFGHAQTLERELALIERLSA